MCAIVFLTFSFVWLYCFQADVLAAAQHVLSKGLTSYKPLVGALLITLVLQVLQLIVYALTRLRKRSHALTYLPSMLALAMITNINSISIIRMEMPMESWRFWLAIKCSRLRSSRASLEK